MPSAFVLSLLPYPFPLVFRHRPDRTITSSSSQRGLAAASSSSSPTVDGSPAPVGQRSFLERSFHQFGQHAAKHQIRVLLICCVVMTSLAFPALAIHYETVSSPASFSSTLRPDSLFSTPLLRPLFDNPPPARDFPFVMGTGFEVETGSDTTQEGGVSLKEGGVSSLAAPGGPAGGRIRMETVWIGELAHIAPNGSPSAQPHLQPSSFDHHAFGSRFLTSLPASFGLLFCSPPEPASVSPPTKPWSAWTCFLSDDGQEHSRWDEIAWKESLVDALNETQTPAAVWGRVDAAERSFLVDYSPPISSPDFVHPDHPPLPSTISRLTSVLPIPIILLYAFLLGWTFRALASFTPVHNQFGLAFTYVTELAISTTCSGSICVVMGWKLEGVPWFLLPFVIGVIGVENMVHVTRAVLSTSISLPVSERLSLGLALSGPTITFTTLSDIGLFSLLGVIVGDRVSAVRDFCIFTVIVLIADWFLIFAFFATVISIDMQRLELADVLTSSPVAAVPTGGISMIPARSISPDLSKARRRRRSKPAKSSSQVLRSGFQAVLRARTARNGTLVFLMTVLIGLWYSYSGSFDLAPMDHRAALIGTKWTSSHGLVGGQPRLVEGDLLAQTGRAHLWDLLNPNHHQEQLTLVVPSPTAVVISTLPHRLDPLDLLPPTVPRSVRSLHRIVKPLTWLSKIVILPIGVSTFALYLLLLYLLKDAELLDAQRDRLEIGEEWEDDGLSKRDAADGRMKPPTMERVVGLHQADVCLIATSADGVVVLSVGFDGIALLSKTGDTAISQRLLLPAANSPDRPRQAVMDAKGSFCAIAFSRGSVFVWSLDPTSLNPTLISFSSSSASSLAPANVSDMSFLPDSSETSPQDDLFTPVPVTVASSVLAVVREDGSLLEYRCVEREMRVALLPGPESVRATCLWKTGRKDVSEVSLVSSSGRVEVVRRNPDSGAWTEVASISATPALELVSNVTTAVVNIEGSSRELIALSSAGGVVSLWDVSDGETILTFGGVNARVTQVRIMDPLLQQCGLCRERYDGFLLLLSTPESLFVHRVVPRQLSTSCNCSPARRSSSSTDRTSLEVPLSRRRGSSISANPAAPPPPPSLSPGTTPTKRLPSSVSNNSTLSVDYPMSVHGVHSRRLSRRSEADEPESEEILADELSPSKEPGSSSPSSWANLRNDLLGTVSVHRGGWETLEGRRVVGFGKGASLSAVDEDEEAPSDTHPSRWQTFQIDLFQPTNGSTLSLTTSDLSQLPAPPPSSLSQLPCDPLDASEGSSLRRRRAERLKQFASQTSAPPPPSVSHALIGPVVAAGTDRVLAGTGNSVSAFVFAALERPDEYPPPAAAVLSLPNTPMRRRVEIKRPEF